MDLGDSHTEANRLPRDHTDALDESFILYSLKVAAYEHGWWIHDSRALSRLLEDPGLFARLRALAATRSLTTRDVHYVNDGWHEERLRLHDCLIADMASRITDSDSPAIVYLLGVPGSGKTSVLRPIAERILARSHGGHPIVRDADELRVQIPEYRSGLGSGVVQDETAEVTYGPLTDAIGVMSNLIVDTVGHPDHLPTEVDHFTDAGMTAYVLCAELPIEVAVRRVKERALATGRYVPISYVESCAGRPRAALERALESRRIEGWAIMDTLDGRTLRFGGSLSEALVTVPASQRAVEER